MFLLEYSDVFHSFHCNYVDASGRFATSILNSGYCPVTLISHELLFEQWFLNLQSDIMRKELCYEDAANMILLALINHYKTN